MPATTPRFDPRHGDTVTWRGDVYANSRDNISFIQLWTKFFRRHQDVFVNPNTATFRDEAGRVRLATLWHIEPYWRPADERERAEARAALRLLRQLGYYTR